MIRSRVPGSGFSENRQLSFASDATDPELKQASDQLLAASSTGRIGDEPIH